ncbi:hypothetical protein QOZ80_3AG0210380 [Eleusine coracana subsp. coracana]|nr:hypothetical protein QOZ80_3AG0210380 [Eleusine coracana subsp. coracana]
MAVSRLVDKLNMQMPVAEKLQRLEVLLLKFHSAIDASEKHKVKNTWLVQWREKLKEAASEGDQVMAVFRQRAMGAPAAGQQQGGSSSSIPPPPPPPPPATSTSALSFTRSALSGMVQGIRSATNRMFFADEDTKKLNSAVERLEKLDLWEFISLLQLEILPKIDHSRPKKRKRLPLPSVLLQAKPQAQMQHHGYVPVMGEQAQLHGSHDIPMMQNYCGRRDTPLMMWEQAQLHGSHDIPEMQNYSRRHDDAPVMWNNYGSGLPNEGRARSIIKEVIRREMMSEVVHGAPRQPVEAWIAETPEYKEYQSWITLQRRLNQVMCRISWAVIMAADRDLDDSGGLAQWAAVLNEALNRGSVAVINVGHSLSKYYSCLNDGEWVALFGCYGTDEVETLVRSLEILAGDVECFGSFLVLCPWDPVTDSSDYCPLSQYQYPH